MVSTSYTSKATTLVLFGLLAHCGSAAGDAGSDPVSSGDEQPLVSEEQRPDDSGARCESSSDPGDESLSTQSLNPCDGQPKFPDGSEACNSDYPSWLCCGKVKNNLSMSIIVAGNRSSGGTGLQPFFTLSAGGTTGASRDIDSIWVPQGWQFVIKGTYYGPHTWVSVSSGQTVSVDRAYRL